MVPRLYLRIALLSLAVACAQPPSHAGRQPPALTFDLRQWPLPGWRPVREATLGKPGPWVVGETGLANLIPPDAKEEDIVAAKDGLGLAAAIFDGGAVKDYTLSARLGFRRKGAPALLLRTQVQGEVTGDTLSLVLYEKGVNLWRFAEGKWSKAKAADFAPEEGVLHRMDVTLVGDAAHVRVDGRTVLKVESLGFDRAGAFGLWAGEGPCFFRSLTFRGEMPPLLPPLMTEVLRLKPPL